MAAEKHYLIWRFLASTDLHDSHPATSKQNVQKNRHSFSSAGKYLNTAP
jgi:hypothetical protein